MTLHITYYACLSLLSAYVFFYFCVAPKVSFYLVAILAVYAVDLLCIGMLHEGMGVAALVLGTVILAVGFGPTVVACVRMMRRILEATGDSLSNGESVVDAQNPQSATCCLNKRGALVFIVIWLLLILLGGVSFAQRWPLACFGAALGFVAPLLILYGICITVGRIRANKKNG